MVKVVKSSKEYSTSTSDEAEALISAIVIERCGQRLAHQQVRVRSTRGQGSLGLCRLCMCVSRASAGTGSWHCAPSSLQYSPVFVFFSSSSKVSRMSRYGFVALRMFRVWGLVCDSLEPIEKIKAVCARRDSNKQKGS